MSDLPVRDRDLLITYVRPQWRRLALFACLLIISIGLTLFNPQIVRFFLDNALAGRVGEPLIAAAALFLVAAAARQGLMLATDYIGKLIAWKATNALRADLALHCLHLDMPFHKVHAPGELIERIDGDVGGLDYFLSRWSIRLAGNTLLVLGIVIALVWEDWRIGLGVSLYVVAALALLWRLQNLGVDKWTKSRQADAEYSSFLEERLQGTEDIRSSGAEQHILTRLGRLTQAMMRSYRIARLTSNITFILSSGLYTLVYGFGLGMGAWLYLQGQTSIGTIYLIVYYITLLGTPIEELRSQVQDLQGARACIGRVANLFAQEPSVREVATRERVHLPAAALAVAFEGVSFRYDEANLALRDVSLQVQPGEVVGVLGRTGSGKTTLTRLLFRLYDPQEGSIRLGGADIRTVGLADLRNRVALVTQDVQLFDATIRDNVTLFNRDIGDAQIETALTALGLWEWVRNHPGGLDGRLSPGGQGMSAGEGQLLAFARAFLKNPGLVVLDEASSRLDPGTEQLVEKAVSQLLRDRTGLVIAHRLRTVLRADTIILFEEGQVVEYGRRKDLERDPQSRFYHLLQVGLEQALEVEAAVVELEEVAA